MSRQRQYPKEVGDFILANYKGITSRELTERLNTALKTDYSVRQVMQWKNNRRLRSGANTRYKPGATPANKGKKIEQKPGSVAARFQPGHQAWNAKPIGSEHVGANGFVYVKVQNSKGKRGQGNFRPKHRVIWEQAHGKLEPGELIIFKDGDKTNVTLENLAKVNAREMSGLVRDELRFSDPLLTETGIAVTKLKIAIKDKVREQK